MSVTLAIIDPAEVDTTRALVAALGTRPVVLAHSRPLDRPLAECAAAGGWYVEDGFSGGEVAGLEAARRACRSDWLLVVYGGERLSEGAEDALARFERGNQDEVGDLVDLLVEEPEGRREGLVHPETRLVRASVVSAVGRVCPVFVDGGGGSVGQVWADVRVSRDGAPARPSELALSSLSVADLAEDPAAASGPSLGRLADHAWDSSNGPLFRAFASTWLSCVASGGLQSCHVACRLAASLLRDNRVGEASQWVARALEAGFDCARSWILLGDIALVRGNVSQAVAAYQQARACRPPLGGWYRPRDTTWLPALRCATALAAAGEADGALRELDEAALRCPIPEATDRMRELLDLASSIGLEDWTPALFRFCFSHS